jgi:endonuclease/exonuclease/phosphatase family metal-dependent hydrolase
MKSRRMFIRRFIWVTAFACLQFIVFSSAALAENNRLNVRVMTRNMDAGTDLNYITPPGANLSEALPLTFYEVYASNIPARVERLADEIFATQPDLIALQEVTRWDIPTPDGQKIYDQLDLLLSALEARGMQYRVAVMQTLTNVSISIPQLFSAQFTDENAILVRSDLPPGQLMIIGTEAHEYVNHLPDLETPLGIFEIPNGWLAADVKIRGARFKFVNTHLLSAVPEAVSPDAFAYTSYLQAEQVVELMGGLSKTSLPIILAGDFNSDAQVPQNAPDATPAAGLIELAFGPDIWHLKNPYDPGYTWPLFGEDFMSGVEVAPFERIDLIFSAGLIPQSIMQTGTEPVGGVYASDHVGVVADFDLENHPPDKPKGKK